MNATIGENKADVICVGSSHVYCGINPIQMYEDMGIVAYDIAEGSQAPWQSYYYIKEVCKTQKPKIIIYDTYMMGTVQSDDGYQDYQTVNNLLNGPIAFNKISAVCASKASSKIDIILNFPYNHDEALPGFSFNKIYGEADYSMGYHYTTSVVPYDDCIDVHEVTEVSAISEKNEKYLKQIIDYCKDNAIKLILTNTPWPCITEDFQKKFNYIASIADDNGVPFIDGCKLFQEMGIDYTVDSSGENGHLNYSGATKYTFWLEQFLVDNYDLLDRRTDEKYDVYKMGIKWLDEQ